MEHGQLVEDGLRVAFVSVHREEVGAGARDLAVAEVPGGGL
jgi:hypothetical protein